MFCEYPGIGTLLFFEFECFKTSNFWMGYKALIDEMFIFVSIGYVCGTERSLYDTEDKSNGLNL